jgi:hypothetical protein
VSKFKDDKGREWDVVTNVLTFGRVREEMKFDLPELLLSEKSATNGEPENRVLDRLTEDVVELAQLLFVMVQDQVEAAGVTQSDFYGSLDEEALTQGLWAVLESVVGFSRSGAKQEALRKVLTTARRVEMLQEAKAQSVLQSPELAAEIEREVQNALSPPTPLAKPIGSDAGNLPDSSESTLPIDELPVGIAFER